MGLRAMGLRWPFARRWPISATFGEHLRRQPPSTAPGVDVAAPRGTRVLAAGAGRVFGVRRRRFGGRSLWVRHGEGVESYYAHLEMVGALDGEQVRAGQALGLVGSTGRATGPHLHFGVRIEGEWVDPLEMLSDDD